MITVERIFIKTSQYTNSISEVNSMPRNVIRDNSRHGDESNNGINSMNGFNKKYNSNDVSRVYGNGYNANNISTYGGSSHFGSGYNANNIDGRDNAVSSYIGSSYYNDIDDEYNRNHFSVSATVIGDKHNSNDGDSSRISRSVNGGVSTPVNHGSYGISNGVSSAFYVGRHGTNTEVSGSSSRTSAGERSVTTQPTDIVTTSSHISS